MRIGLVSILSLTLLGGCIVRTGPGQQRRGCPPSQHWNGVACVHNGHGHGHGHHDGRGHGRGRGHGQGHGRGHGHH